MDRRRPPQRAASFPSAPGLRPWLLVLLFSIFILLFLPSFLSKGLRPAAAGLIKNGWDALNFLLVLFAILCGLLSRNSNPDDSPRHPKPELTPATPSYHYQPSPFNTHRRSSSYPDLRQEVVPAEHWRFSDDIQLSRSSVTEAMPQSWKVNDSSLPELHPKVDETVASNHNSSMYTEEIKPEPEAVIPERDLSDYTLPHRTPLSGRRMRSSSSYQDLRQEWIPAEDWRFFDDIDLHRRQPEVRTIPVDTVKLQSNTPPPLSPPRQRRTTRNIPKSDLEPETSPVPPPPLPSPTPPQQHQRKKSGGVDTRNRGWG